MINNEFKPGISDIVKQKIDDFTINKKMNKYINEKKENIIDYISNSFYHEYMIALLTCLGGTTFSKEFKFKIWDLSNLLALSPILIYYKITILASVEKYEPIYNYDGNSHLLGYMRRLLGIEFTKNSKALNIEIIEKINSFYSKNYEHVLNDDDIENIVINILNSMYVDSKLEHLK